uniref:Uncharacterized protein n=1 Tax=Sinocyclocheilus grahami TaxID=75366 RepID=A0A672T8D6_SINGR
MFAKGKGTAVPSDGQAREKLALYVYEYLLHVGAQKSAQTFLSEIRWEKNITLGEPPGFLHSWCVFWDLYCAAPERRDTCDHSSEAKAFHDYSAAAAPSPVLGNMPPGDSMPGGPMPPGFFQGPPGSQPSPHTQLAPNPNMMGAHGQPFMSPRYAGGPRPPIRMGNPPPGGQPLPPNMMDPTRPTGHPNLAPMQRMNAPRGMGPMGPGPQVWLLYCPKAQLHNWGISDFWQTWLINNLLASQIPYSSSSPGTYLGPPGGAGGGGCPPGTPIMPSPADSTNSGENLYTLINSVPPGGNRSNFPMGPGSDGPMGGLEPHHMNGSLGKTPFTIGPPGGAGGGGCPPGTPIMPSPAGNGLSHFCLLALCHRNGAWLGVVRIEFYGDSLKSINLHLCVHRLH